MKACLLNMLHDAKLQNTMSNHGNNIDANKNDIDSNSLSNVSYTHLIKSDIK